MLSRWQDGRVELGSWLSREDIAVAAIDEADAKLAADAFVRFGKGRHPAGLNFGSCFSCALAKSLAAPLLFKGEDFAQTDIAAAI